MNLYLMRHGLANWPAWSGPDDERPLTPDGLDLLRAEAAALARLGLRPEAILHSPLTRARQTAEQVAAALGCGERTRPEALLRPGFGLPALHSLLRRDAPAAEWMLVGHAPDMARLVHGLTGGRVHFKEGAVACVRIEKPGEPLEGALTWLATAEFLSALSG